MAKRDDTGGWVLRVIPMGADAAKAKPQWLQLAPRGSPVILTEDLRKAQVFASKEDAMALPKPKSPLFCPELKADAAKGEPPRSYEPDPNEGLPPSSIKRGRAPEGPGEAPAPRAKQRAKGPQVREETTAASDPVQPAEAPPAAPSGKFNEFGLTAQQEEFCKTYVEMGGAHGSASEAYRRTCPSSLKWKPESVHEVASRLLANGKVASRIEALKAKMREIAEEKFEITAERILGELGSIGFANMLDFVTLQEDGTAYVDLSRLDRRKASALQEVTVDSYTEGRGEYARDVKRVKIKLADKRAALVDLGKHLNLFVERHELTGKGGGPIQTQTQAADAFIAELTRLRKRLEETELAGGED